MREWRYVPGHEPPRLSERVIAHIVELILAVWSAYAGALILADTLMRMWDSSQSMQALPVPLSATVGVLLIVGGSLGAAGMLSQPRIMDVKWRMEKTGWPFAAAGFASYGIAVLSGFPASMISWGAAFTYAAMCAARFAIVLVIERQTRESVRWMRWGRE